MKTNLDVGHLRRTLPNHESLLALLAFAQEGDMVRAAKSLQLSQPALSFHLKKVEEQLGFPVFVFSGKRKLLTQQGLAYAREISYAMERFQRSSEKVLRESMQIEKQKLRVAGRRELLISLLQFPFPGQIEFIQTSSSAAIRSLREHQVDLAIGARLDPTVQSSADLMAKVFFESGFKIIIPAHWKLKTVEALRDESVVAYGNQHTYLDEYFKSRDWNLAEQRVSRVVEDWFSVVELVRYGFGWSIIPESWELHSDQVKALPIADENVLRQKVYLYFRRADRKSERIKVLEDWLKAR